MQVFTKEVGQRSSPRLMQRPRRKNNSTRKINAIRRRLGGYPKNAGRGVSRSQVDGEAYSIICKVLEE
ncbi:hypothetical protein RB195_005646 [Necator americanus]|uniref:Uncharacterized protein n=1 Tax=Necator americanus TaxID=51031 RepID=A0ABR1BSQ7_NECAM